MDSLQLHFAVQVHGAGTMRLVVVLVSHPCVLFNHGCDFDKRIDHVALPHTGSSDHAHRR